MSTEPKMTPWFAGWGSGKTGPTCPAPTTVCGGMDWPLVPVGYGQETIAIVVMQDGGTKEEMQQHAALIATAPEQHELLQTFTEWARQIAGRDGLPQGIRSAAANLHDDGKRLIAKATRAP